MLEKKLFKSNSNRMIDGVCGGVAEYLGVDATVVRVIWAICGLAAFTGVIAYIVAAVLIPRQPL